jgi:four helix bundle protein
MGIRRSHKDLLAWQEAMRLVVAVYRITSRFPKEEIYGLTQQMRRSAVSIPSNIAEGAGRNGTRELAQFLGVACGSFAELETQLELAQDLGLLERDAELMKLTPRVGMLLRRLRESVMETPDK